MSRVEGRDYHFGPLPLTQPARHDGSRESCWYPECDMTNRQVTRRVRQYLREHNASSIVETIQTTWHNGCRHTLLFPVEGREAEVRALVQDETLKDLARSVAWSGGYVEIFF